MTISNTAALEMMTSARKGISKIAGTFGRTMSKSDTDDLVQASLVKAIEYYDDSKGTPGAIAYMVSCTVATDFLRGRTYAGGSKDLHLADQGSTNDDGEAVEIDVQDSEPSVLDMMIRNEITCQVAESLATLNARQREVISLYLADDVAMANGDRPTKKRAIEAMQESIGYKVRKAR